MRTTEPPLQGAAHSFLANGRQEVAGVLLPASPSAWGLALQVSVDFPVKPSYHCGPMEGSTMIPSVWFHKLLLQLAVVSVLTTAALSQAPKYDRATETTLKGTVEEFKLVPPSGTKPIA